MASSNPPRPRAGILEIEPYVAGQSSVPGRNRVIKLSSNETPLGPSPRAIEAFRAAAADLFSYPEGSGADLRAALARKYGLEAERIVLGNGSDEILSVLAQAYLSPAGEPERIVLGNSSGEVLNELARASLAPGDEAVMTEHSFPIYRIATLAANARPIAVPLTDYRADVDALLQAVTPRTRVVFVCNPDNPSGTYLSRAELERLHAGLPSNVLLVVDGAYAEYARAADYSPGDFLARRAENVVMTRTFSKIYGLAALRIGWAYAPPAIAEVVNRIRLPFNTNRPAQMAALAALTDEAHFKAAYEHNAKWLPWLESEIGKLGVRVVPSQGNFMLLDFSGFGKGVALAADAALKNEGLILRTLVNYGLPECLRLTVGLEEANRAVVQALEKFLAGRK